MINKYVGKSLARKNVNEILIWSWNNPGTQEAFVKFVHGIAAVDALW